MLDSMKTGGLTTLFVFLRCNLQIEQLQSDLTSAQQREAELKTVTATQSTMITVHALFLHTRS